MKTSQHKKGKAVLFAILMLFLIFLISMTIWFLSIFFSVALKEDTIVVPARNLVLTDEKNEEIPVNSTLNKYVPYDQINQNIINAFVSTEDKRFFNHKGVDYKRTVGALVHNLQAGYAKEGGSTITQQLIKNTQLTAEKSMERKIKEMRLAYQIEEKYSKTEILEMYLNAIYFGNGIYGIDEACKQYFDKTPLEITVSEAAVLAGVVKNPRKNSLLNSVENANARKNLILRLMFEQNYIDEAEYDMCLQEIITPAETDKTYRPYSAYVDGVLTEASEILGISEKELIEGKYRIITYLDKSAQDALYEAYKNGDFMPKNSFGTVPAYASLSLNNQNGGITTFVSDLKQSFFDFRRQPGSTIKPFLSYLPALEKLGYCALTKVDDAPFLYGDYAPKNYHENYLGSTPFREAVATSSNAVAVSIANNVGISYAKSLAERAGLRFHEDDNTLPIALGGMCEGVTFAELAAAYMTLANGGIYLPTAFIKAIFSPEGNTLYQRKISGSMAFSEENAALMTDMLVYTAQHGTAKKLSKLPFEVAGKTGTVGRSGGGNNDAWCTAYTSENTALCWYGNLQKNAEGALSDDITGGSYPASMCAELLRQIQRKKPNNFKIPPTVTEATIDKSIYDTTGEMFLAPETFPDSLKITALFSVKNTPQIFSPNAVIAEPEGLNLELFLYPYLSFFTKSTEIYRVYRQNGQKEVLLQEIMKQDAPISILDDSIAGGGLVTYRIEVSNLAGLTENFYRSILFLSEHKENTEEMSSVFQ